MLVYVMLADGFEEIEALCPVDILRRADIEVKTVSVAQRRVTGAHGIAVEADLVITDIGDTVPQMLVLPGGMPGTTNLDRCPELHALIERTAHADGFLCAICAAPMILGYSGYLFGKRATCFPGFEKYLIGATKCPERVVRDRNIITACGMGAAKEFGLALLGALAGEECAQKIADQIQG